MSNVGHQRDNNTLNLNYYGIVLLFASLIQVGKWSVVPNNLIITLEAGLTPREPSISYDVYDCLHTIYPHT